MKKLCFYIIRVMVISCHFLSLLAMEKEKAGYKKGIEHYKHNEFEQSVKQLKQAVNSTDEFIKAHALHAIGTIYLKQKDYEKAEIYLLRSLACKERPNALFNNLGIVYWKTWRIEKAIECFKQALAVKDECVQQNIAILLKDHLAHSFAPEALQSLAFDNREDIQGKEEQVSQEKAGEPVTYKEPETNNIVAIEPVVPKKPEPRRKHRKKPKRTSVKQEDPKEKKETEESPKKENNNTLYEWRCEHIFSHKLLQGHKDPCGTALALYCNKDGTELAILTYNYLYLWDTQTGICKAIKELADKVTIALAKDHPLVSWNEDTRELYVVTATGIIKVHALDESPFHLVLKKEGTLWPQGQSHGTFNKNTTLFAALIEHAGQKLLVYWDLESGRMKILDKGPFLTTLIGLHFTHDNKLCGVMKNGLMKVWDLAGNCSTSQLQVNGTKMISASVSPDGRLISMRAADGTKLFSSATLKELPILQESNSAGYFARDGSCIVVAYASGNITVFSGEGKVLSTLQAGRERFLQVCLNNSNDMFFARTESDKIQIWKRFEVPEVRVNQEQLPLVKEQPVPALFIRIYCPNIQFEGDLASVEGDIVQENVTTVLCDSSKHYISIYMAHGSTIIVRPARQDQFELPVQHKGYIWVLRTIKHRGVLASAGEDCLIHLWNLKERDCCGLLKGHKAPIWSLAYDEETETLFSGAQDGVIHKWNPKYSELIGSFIGHTKRVNDVKSFAVLQDAQIPSKILLSASDDCTVRLWNRETGTCIKIFTGHTKPVRQVTYCNKHDLVVSTSEDYTLRLWDIRSGECQKVEGLLNFRVKKVTVNEQEDFISVVYSDGTTSTYPIVKKV